MILLYIAVFWRIAGALLLPHGFAFSIAFETNNEHWDKRTGSFPTFFAGQGMTRG